jgi:hypothetical protein
MHSPNFSGIAVPFVKPPDTGASCQPDTVSDVWTSVPPVSRAVRWPEPLFSVLAECNSKMEYWRALSDDFRELSRCSELCEYNY